MKFDLEIENEVGCIAITLNKDFVEGEMEAIVKMAKSLLKPKMTREEALSWAKAGANSPDVLAWGDHEKYYELSFLNPRNKIVAIKALRTALSCGLKEAKDMVENEVRCPPLSQLAARTIRESMALNGVTEYLLKEVE